MSSNEILVSLCVIRIEVSDYDSEQDVAMAVRKMRGCREPREITIENYSNSEEGPVPLLHHQNLNKSHSTSRMNSEESSISQILSEGATSCNVADQINFFSGNPFVEVTKGILHLFKEDELTDVQCAATRSNTICMLSVPATMTCHDVLTFTAACHQNIQHFRILRDDNPDQYMALITFRNSAAASEFYETFNGAPYNSLEPDVVCHLVFVSKVEVGGDGLPIAGHTELPSCPVCLERMDESVDGILTVLCNHTFHASCLVKWGDTSCPICRYAQTPEPLADSHCMECVPGTSNDSLWICLICGHIGCSRYTKGHAFEHYQDTHHCYAMQLGNNRVWDYVADTFVHRLLQDKDGKMVEGHEPSKVEGASMDEKVDSVQLEFTYLLTSQLETQRQFFEDRLNRFEQRTVAETSELRDKLTQVIEENTDMKKKVTSLTKEKVQMEKKIQATSQKLEKTQTELVEEKALRKSLEMNQTSWQTKHKQLSDELIEVKTKKEAEVVDLKEQLRDIMFFFEAQKQIESSDHRDEIAEGRIIVGPEANTSKNSSRASKRHSKR